MKKIFLFMTILSSASWAKIVLTLDETEHPYEIKALLTTLSQRPLQDREQIEVEILINKFSESLQKINKADAFLLLKGELYKTLLDYPLIVKNAPTQLNWELYQLAKRKIELNKTKLSPFFSWLFQAMIEDLSQYEADQYLATYLREKQSSPPRDERELVLKRRIKFLTPWIVAIGNQDPLVWERTLTPVLLDLLRKLETVTQTMKMISPASATRANAAIQIKRTTDQSAETPEALTSPEEAETPKTLTSTTENIVKPESAPEKELNNLFDSVEEEETLTPTKIKGWTPK